MGVRSSPMSDPDAWGVSTCPTCGQETWARGEEHTEPPNKHEEERWRIWNGIRGLVGPGPLLENLWRLVFHSTPDN